MKHLDLVIWLVGWLAAVEYSLRRINKNSHRESAAFISFLIWILMAIYLFVY